MPVIDHPIHPSTQFGADFRYGCWNRPDKFAPHYWAPQRRFFPDGSFDVVSVRVPFRMSHECRSDGINGLGREDGACAGCQHIRKATTILESGK